MWAVDTNARQLWELKGGNGDDLYGCLGVPDTATKSQLKQSYIAGMRELHPDRDRRIK